MRINFKSKGSSARGGGDMLICIPTLGADCVFPRVDSAPRFSARATSPSSDVWEVIVIRCRGYLMVRSGATTDSDHCLGQAQKMLNSVRLTGSPFATAPLCT